MLHWSNRLSKEPWLLAAYLLAAAVDRHRPASVAAPRAEGRAAAQLVHFRLPDTFWRGAREGADMRRECPGQKGAPPFSW